MKTGKIRVLVVDDSAMVRRLASDALRAAPDIEVIGTAGDPYEAQEKIQSLNPDVITLDLEMPRMDGLTFLGLLMERRPMPVIVMSSLTQNGSDFGIEALRLGAIDVIGKPSGSYSFGDVGLQLVEKVRIAAGARPRRAESPAPNLHRPSPPAGAPPGPGHQGPAAAAPARGLPAQQPPPIAAVGRRCDPRSLVLLGASTGGTEALTQVLRRLPADTPAVALVQHIPPVFSKSFAARLDQVCSLEVREAVHGDRLAPGLALVAPGGRHMLLRWDLDHYRVELNDGPQIWHQRPAVDVLFKSLADTPYASHAIAGILTGMGRDGAQGLLSLRENGAQTFAQDEATSVVYGMPRAAWENGAAQLRLPLQHIAEYIVETCRRHARPSNIEAIPGI